MLRLPSLVVIAACAASASASAPEGPGKAYRTAKTLDVVQKCLTDTLSQLGEVVALHTEINATTLLLRNNPEGPMVIDLAPPTVTVTTKFIHGTRKMVERCV